MNGPCVLIKNDGIGDLILASGVIASIARHFGGMLDLVTCGQNADIARRIPGVRRVITVSRDAIDVDRATGEPLLTGYDQRALSRLSEERYGTAIALRRFIRASTVGIMRSVNAGKRFCCWQYPTNLTPEETLRLTPGWTRREGPSELMGESLYYRDFAENLLGGPVDAAPNLNLADAAGLPRRPGTVGLGIDGRGLRHAQILELARILHSRGHKLVVFGGRALARLGREIEWRFPGTINLVDALTLDETIPELAELSAYVGHDTGLTHLALMLVEKCVVIHGGGGLSRFFPWPGKTNQHIIYNSLGCFDCTWECKRKSKRCLNLIEPVKIADFFEEVNSGGGELLRDLNPAASDFVPDWNLYGKPLEAWGNVREAALATFEGRAAHFRRAGEPALKEPPDDSSLPILAKIFSADGPTPADEPLRVIIFGAGKAGVCLKRCLPPESYRVLAFADNSGEKQKILVDGLPVLSPLAIGEVDHDLIAVASMYSAEIVRQLTGLGYPEEKVYVVDMGTLGLMAINRIGPDV